MQKIQALLKPLALLLLVAIAAYTIGGAFPLLGAPLAAILLGALLAPWVSSCAWASWYGPASRRFLLWAVVLLGFSLDFKPVLALGGGVLGFLLATVAFSLAWASLLGRVLRLKGNRATLVAVGTSVCGGSAIAAVSGIIHAREEEVGQALSTIFLYNILAAILFPVAGHWLGLDQTTFGLWAGTAVNDTSSVLAAGFAYGDEAGRTGMVVKLARTLTILPIGLVLAYRMRSMQNGPVDWRHLVPWPLVGFVCAAFLRGVITNLGGEFNGGFTVAAHGLMVLALASIGLRTRLGSMVRKDWRVLAQGGGAWIGLSVFSLLGIKLFMRLGL